VLSDCFGHWMWSNACYLAWNMYAALTNVLHNMNSLHVGILLPRSYIKECRQNLRGTAPDPWVAFLGVSWDNPPSSSPSLNPSTSWCHYRLLGHAPGSNPSTVCSFFPSFPLYLWGWLGRRHDGFGYCILHPPWPRSGSSWSRCPMGDPLIGPHTAGPQVDLLCSGSAEPFPSIKLF
jgi:hypothetical protein